MNVAAKIALPSCNDTKERMSLAFLRAVAARCRSFATCEEGGEYAGLDATITSATQPRRMVCVQLKCTSTPLDRIGGDVAYDLPVENYEHLRRTDASVPMLLVVQEMPEATGQWLSVSANDLILRRAAWWIDLWGRPATKNIKTTRIHIPETQQFTPDALTGIYAAMASIATGAPRKPLHEF